MAHHDINNLRERTLNNENLAGPEVNRAGVGGNHADLHDQTLMNENLTPPMSGMTSPPLEKDFSNGTGKCEHTSPSACF